MLRTLGEVGVAGRGFARPKPLLLLAYLTLEGAQTRRHLAELFWPRSDGARRALTTTLGRLRTAFPGAVAADERQVWSPLECDVRELRVALRDGELERALTLYRGPFLEQLDLDDLSPELEEWIYRVREALASELQEALLTKGLLLAAREEFDEAARAAVRAWNLAGAAPPVPQALTKFHALLLAAGDPLACTVAAEAASFGLNLPGNSAGAREVLRSLGPRETPNRLPLRGGPFVGREVELAELDRALAGRGQRLITLVGPGGNGKTRLALEAARVALLAGSFPDGVYFVPLEALRDSAQVPQAVAEVLRLDVHDSDQAERKVVEHLGRKRVLLVLDNVEQLAGVEVPIAGLLEACPQLTLLVTSRHRLGAASEWTVALPGLAFPDATLPAEEAAIFDAPRLFLQRARQAGGRVDLGAELPHILRLCRLLEGAPLGLELAASWAGLLSCREIADEVESSFDLLTRTPGAAGPGGGRQDSLRAAFAHSWSLLSEEERHALKRFALARGGFTREFATEVAGAQLPILLSLADKSLLERSRSSGRFRLLEVTREYALERLREDPDELLRASRRHVAYFAALAREGEAGLRGDRQVEWMERLGAERDNLRAALDYSLRFGEIEAGLAICASLQMFWWMRGAYREGLQRSEELLAAAAQAVRTVSPSVRAKALHRAGTLAQELGEHERARGLYLEALELVGEGGAGAGHREGAHARTDGHADVQVRADALHSLGLLASKGGDTAAADEFYGRCLSLQRELGDRWGLSATLNNMGVNRLYAGRFEEGRGPLLEALAHKRAMGEKQGIAYALHNLGTASYGLGDLARAQELVEESLALKRELGDEHALATSFCSLGRIAMRRGQLGPARERLAEGLNRLVRVENRWSLTTELASAVLLEALLTRFAAALRLCGYIEQSCREMKMCLPWLAREELERGRQLAARALGESEAATLIAEGRVLTMADVAGIVAMEQPAGAADGKSLLQQRSKRPSVVESQSGR